MIELACAIQERLLKVRERIERACLLAGRSAEEVRIIGVTKGHGPELIEAAYAAGLEEIGENRVQELLAKQAVVRAPVRWHLVGHLQRNKVKYLLGRVVLVHSLDSEALAQEIEKRAAAANLIVPCLVEVNVSGEPSKYGVRPEMLPRLLEVVSELAHLRVEGLMTVAAYLEPPEAVAPQFALLRELRERYANAFGPNVSLRELSMGMSHDFEVAVREGATMIRLGTLLFGPRS
ncbi:MAG: YggS family pyridoxal phosphate-dependent enzyme [Bacteroidetes bacterium]|nr:YggS family pyridoxal phosphate-dependent enzyme [Bacteroidota bacterium]MCX7907599.1 YggS family pyridoxal phosphate-dependent enzyme [Bacteroidota bacterium]MDW8138593.1 YggS family pyridoxal phosphate-dependent enzyme [Bacteroidota bacterium]